MYWYQMWDGCTGTRYMVGVYAVTVLTIMISDFQIYLSPLESLVGMTIDTSRTYLGSGSLSLSVPCTHVDTNKAHE